MATVTIPDAVYQRLQQRATAMRLPLDQYLDKLAANGPEPTGNSYPAGKPGTAEWAYAFDAWVSSHPRRPFVADDSRDAIYGDECD